MRVLIVGGGGREHAMADRAWWSRHRPEILCAPGNAGTAAIAENVPIAAHDIKALIALALEREIDLTIVGPESPLCAGIVDAFEAAGLRIFGPTKAAARIEGDKCYAKTLLLESRIPTAKGRSFARFADAKEYIATRDTPQVVKASGLAAGKGVVVCDDPSDALIVAERMMVGGLYGDAGRSIVVEEKLTGEELSVHAVIGGRNIYVLESSQDHKRIGDGDTGPNTGGMGAYSPAPIATDAVMRSVETDVLIPIVDTLRRHEIDYRGVLYCGLMITPGGPRVLEFNCRFGDPEAQVILPRMRSDFLDLLNACIDGKLDDFGVDWDPRPAVCVVAAAKGYPGPHEKDKRIEGLDHARAPEDVHLYHAGTQLIEGVTYSNGGRVLSVTALGDTVREARDRAYDALRGIRFDGMQYRSDIAYRALANSP